LSGRPTIINFIPLVTLTSMVIVVASIPLTALPYALTNIDKYLGVNKLKLGKRIKKREVYSEEFKRAFFF
jgi:hypothetical protein